MMGVFVGGFFADCLSLDLAFPLILVFPQASTSWQRATMVTESWLDIPHQSQCFLLKCSSTGGRLIRLVSTFGSTVGSVCVCVLVSIAGIHWVMVGNRKHLTLPNLPFPSVSPRSLLEGSARGFTCFCNRKICFEDMFEKLSHGWFFVFNHVLFHSMGWNNNLLRLARLRDSKQQDHRIC